MDFDDDDGSVQLPCEFCEVLYPWSLLAEHQIVCELNPEVLDFVPFVPAENSGTVRDQIKEEIDVKQAQVLNVPYEKLGQPQMPSHTTATRQEANRIPVIDPHTGKNVFGDENTVQNEETRKGAEKIIPSESIELAKVITRNVENQQNQVKKFTSQTEEFMTKTGEKLLVYGANIDPVEDLDTDKQSSKISNPLTSNIPKEEDVEDINNLSDDDCEETLEDFWKRARDFLKRNKTKIEC